MASELTATEETHKNIYSCPSTYTDWSCTGEYNALCKLTWSYCSDSFKDVSDSTSKWTRVNKVRQCSKHNKARWQMATRRPEDAQRRHGWNEDLLKQARYKAPIFSTSLRWGEGKWDTTHLVSGPGECVQFALDLFTYFYYILTSVCFRVALSCYHCISAVFIY